MFKMEANFSDTHLLLEVEDSLSQTLDIRIQLVRLPHQSHAFCDQNLDLLLKAGNQEGDGRSLLDLFASALVGAHALDQRDGKRVKLVGLVGFVDDGQWDAEAQPLEVAHLFRQGDDLREEVDFQLEHVSGTAAGSSVLYCEDAARHSKVTLLNLDFFREDLQNIKC